MPRNEIEAPPVFEGLRVLDVGSFIAGPGAATILSDLGAEVIKVEPPRGDPWRGQFRRPGLPTPPSNFDYMWALAARNRRSVVLNLKKPEGQAALHKLVETADVFVTNMPLKVRGRLNIEHDWPAP
jgi:formyl-CoA transferase